MVDGLGTDPLVTLYRAVADLARAAVAETSESWYFDAAVGALTNGPDVVPTVPASRPVVDDWLEPALALAPCRLAPVVGAIAAGAERLSWVRSYDDLAASEPLDAFRDHYSWAPLAPAPVAVDRLIGLTLQAPGIDYPSHQHAPAELYGIIAGHADWQIGDGPYEPKRAGDVMVHEPGQAHAMLTHDQPLLCWVIWADQPDAAAAFVKPPSEWATGSRAAASSRPDTRKRP